MLSVGVLTMPGSDTLGPEPLSYLTYDNYKWLTRAGLQIVPIPVGTSDDEALVYFNQLQGLYLAGGSAHPGPGMPMVMMSGWIAADCVDQDKLVEQSADRPATCMV